MSYYSGCDCSSGFFVGATRTYIYFAPEFEDWCKKLVDSEELIDQKHCAGFRSLYNICEERVGEDTYDYAYSYYYHYLSTQMYGGCATLNPNCTEAEHLGVVLWKEDDGVSAGPIAGQICYTANKRCKGGTFGVTNDFRNKLEDAYNQLNPYPYSGFVYDYFGMVGQGPASSDTAGGFVSYCGAGISTTIVSPWFVWRGFESKVFLFDKSIGIPYTNPSKLTEFHDNNPWTVTDISVGQLADEVIQITGAANWNYGDISFRGTALWADYMGDNATTKYDRLASYTNGSGASTYNVNGLSWRDTAIQHKNCDNYTDFKNYPWIRVEIPAPLEAEKKENVQYSSFFIVPSESTMNKALYGTQSWSFHGIGWVIPIVSDAIYFKRYTKKIVKAPHVLYLKEGETSFRSCGYGETLADLEPGRYYFPNMCYGCLRPQNLSFYASAGGAKETYLVSDGELAQFFDDLPTQFNSSSGISTLDEKFQNAIEQLGYPSKTGSIAIEGQNNYYNEYMSLEESIAFCLDIINRATP